MNKFWHIIDVIAQFFMRIILKIVHVEWTDDQWTSFLQFVKFAVVGVSNTLLSYIINIVVLLILSPLKLSWDFYAGNTVAFILSVLWSFYWNNKYVFEKKEGSQRSIWKALLKTYACYALSGIVIANILSWLTVSVLHVSKYIAPLINLVISVPLNFILNRLWAFKAD